MKTFDKNYLKRNQDNISYAVARKLFSPLELPVQYEEMKASKSSPKLRLVKSGKRIALAAIVATVSTGCTGTFQYGTPWDDGKMLMTSDAETLSRDYDGKIGLTHAGKDKESQHNDTDYFIGRTTQQKELTNRYRAGFASKQRNGGAK